MHSTSDLMRPSAAPNHAQANPDPAAPRRRLVAEVWVPEQPAREAVPVRLVGRPMRRRDVSRGLTAVAVALLHASLGAWLWTTGVGHPPAAPIESLVLLTSLAAPAAARPKVDVEVPVPDLLPVPLDPAMPRLPRLSQGSSEIALSITPATDVVISDANARDVAQVRGGCSADKARTALSSDRMAEITLLVRVETDGRVSDSKVEVGSGEQRLDEAAQRCLRTHGSFAPRRINGAPVASWLRVHWPAV